LFLDFQSETRSNPLVWGIGEAERERVKEGAQAPESNLFFPDVVHIFLNVT